MKAMFLVQVFFLGLCNAFILGANSCKSPPVATGFQNERYNGLWYEVSKAQTAGGGFFEKDCVCTTIDVQPVPSSTAGDSKAINSCRKLAPSGDFMNATGTLSNEGPLGHWKEGFFPGAPKADYTIIYLTDNVAVEYDCSSFLGLITNYCIHILSRTPTITPDGENAAIKYAESLGLNTQNLPYHKTLQSGCW
ncbi:apolipoprotein D-like [Saccostrea echinata]|uniref:apolipoprotein D-like n=1 Tax=Saccostrea echinata TaxID=191078 RepID=UPI002A7FDC6F|nr:apolipoprotein D-like [Saccostrea echinata]